MKYFDLPPIWLMGFAALAWATARLGFGFAVPHWGHWAAGGIIVVSVGVMGAAVVAMLRHIDHRDPASAAVDIGENRRLQAVTQPDLPC